jgi:ABC-type phosphate/phosphonate transport system substrate-binding protein
MQVIWNILSGIVFMKVARFIFSFWILVLALSILSSAVSAAEQEKVICVVGYSIRSVSDVDPRDAEAALRVWVKELADQYGFEVKLSLYDSVDKLIVDFIHKKLDFIVMTSIDYLRLSKMLKAKPEVTQIRNGKPTVKYLMLVNEDIHKLGLGSLKNKKLSILKSNHLGLLFLDTHLMQAKLPPSERFFSAIQERNKESQAILDVFFGHADICIVNDVAFHTMTELNPQVGRKLRVIAESPNLINTVGIFRPDYPPGHKKRAIQGMNSDYKHHERGKQIMLLFNIEKMDVITDGQLDSVRILFAEHDRLKRR